MLLYSKSCLNTAELHFKESTPVPGGADVVRYQFRTEAIRGTCTYRFHSIFIKLEEDPDQLLARMSRRTREVIRQTLKIQDAIFDFQPNPAPELIKECPQFYDEFARDKDLPGISRARMEAIHKAGALTLSRMTAPDGSTAGLARACPH